MSKRHKWFVAVLLRTTLPIFLDHSLFLIEKGGTLSQFGQICGRVFAS